MSWTNPNTGNRSFASGQGAQSGSGFQFGAIPVVGGLLDSIFGNRSRRRAQRESERRQHGYNMELAQFNFDKSLEMWNLENAYNDPTAQMRRLREAGINPHLAYAQGSIDNVAGQGPQMKADPPEARPAPKNMPFEAMLRMYQHQRLQTKQENLMQAQIENLNAKSGTETVIKGVKEIEKLKSQLSFKKDSALYETSVDYQKELLNKARNEVSNLGKQGLNLDADRMNKLQDLINKMDQRELRRFEIDIKKFERDFLYENRYPVSKEDPINSIIQSLATELGLIDWLKNTIREAKGDTKAQRDSDRFLKARKLVPKWLR